jgi:molecular chaperone GrpE (heat shock protein)
MDNSNTDQIKSQNNKDQPKLEKNEEDKQMIKKEEKKENKDNKENKKDSKEEKSDKKESKEVKEEKKEPPKEKTIDEKYKDALSEIKKLKENNMYLQAEMENTRKVTQKRMEMAVYQSRCDTIQQFLPIIESIDSAISRLETSNNKKPDPRISKLFKWIQTSPDPV